MLLGTAPSSTNYSSLGQSLEQLEEVTLGCPDLGIAVRKYVQGIHLYLKEKEYGPCAWDLNLIMHSSIIYISLKMETTPVFIICCCC